MLNKNDPLIGAVQEVMKRNQLERDAAKLVNEKFGVQDRKAMPHEKLGAWDAAYKQVLSEGLHPNQQKLDVHEPEKDKLTKHDFKMLRAKKKPMEEENAPKTDPYAEGQASSISTVAQPKKEVTPADQSALKKKIMSIKEAKSNAYAIGMAAVKKSTGDEPPMEKKNVMKAHKIAKKIIAKKKIDEGFNNRHGLSVNASAEKQAVAALNEQEDSYDPAKETQKKFAKLSGADAGKKVKNYLSRSKYLKANPPQGTLKKEPGNYYVNKTVDQLKAAGSGALGLGSDYEKFYPRAAETGKLLGVGSMLMPGRPAAAVGQQALRKGASIVPQIAKGTGQGNRIAAIRRTPTGPWGKTADAAVQGAKVPARAAPSGTFLANLQRSRQAAQSARVGGSTVGATQTATRAKMAQTAQNARAGGSTVAATQQAAKATNRAKLSQTVKDLRTGAGNIASKTASAVRQNPKMAVGAAAGAALGGFAATKLANQPPPAQAQTGVTAKKIEATPRKVTDTEIMNSPQYKQAVKSVGGDEAARKIQPGTDVAGIGKVEKGQTIWSKVKSQLEKQPAKGFEAGANKGGAGR